MASSWSSELGAFLFRPFLSLYSLNARILDTLLFFFKFSLAIFLFCIFVFFVVPRLETDGSVNITNRTQAKYVYWLAVYWSIRLMYYSAPHLKEICSWFITCVARLQINQQTNAETSGLSFATLNQVWLSANTVIYVLVFVIHLRDTPRNSNREIARPKMINAI